MRRWAGCAAMMLVSLISYVDRNTLALLSPTILRETGLSAAQYGWIISAFSVAYMIGNPLWGRVLDRVGVFAGMLVAVALWSVASASHALAAGFFGFAAARALLGLGEGATFPGGLRTAMQTLPPSRRGRGVALAYSGGSLGAILTPLVVTPVAVRFGWRSAFLLTGLLGAVWLAGWSLGLRNEPALRSANRAAPASAVRLADPRLWAFMAVYALGALPLGFVLYAAPIYLSKELHLSQSTLGRWLWLPPLGWEVGYFFWGWLADRMTRDRADAFHGKLFALLALLGLPLGLVPSLTHLGSILLVLFAGMFVAAGFIMVAIAYATRVFSAQHAGWIAGIGAGSWSAVVAVTMPLFGRLFDDRLYGPAFLLAAIVPVAGFAAWCAGAAIIARHSRAASA